MATQPIHETQPALTYGTDLAGATVAVLLMHGRGATAQSLLGFTQHLPGDGVAYVLPQAAGNTWYPNSGFAPFEVNEPFLSSAWNTIAARLQAIQEAGIPPERTILGGFSQGACLSSEFVARHARRYGGLLVLSGALMGDEDTSREYAGSLAGTPVFVGGATHDPWVTETQLRATADILSQLGGEVTIEVHRSADHTIRPADIENATRIIQAALTSA